MRVCEERLSSVLERALTNICHFPEQFDGHIDIHGINSERMTE